MQAETWPDYLRQCITYHISYNIETDFNMAARAAWAARATEANVSFMRFPYFIKLGRNNRTLK